MPHLARRTGNGQFETVGSGDGQFNTPEGIAVSSSGIVYVADENNSRIQRWQITEPTPAPTPPAVPQLTVEILTKERTTTAATFKIKGSATDLNGTLTRVEVKVGRAAYKPAGGQENWNFTATKLQPGRTKILVRALDVSRA